MLDGVVELNGGKRQVVCMGRPTSTRTTYLATWEEREHQNIGLITMISGFMIIESLIIFRIFFFFFFLVA